MPLPEPNEPVRRVMTREQAAAYVGCESTGTFSRYMKLLGIKPLSHRRGCYDRMAIDAAMDKESGLDQRSDKLDDDDWLHDG